MEEPDEGGALVELTGLVLDEFGPALQWYRAEVGRLLGLAPAEVVCLELCRRFRTVSSGRIGERTGQTRSAVATMLRRLEEAGHLARVPSRDHAQEVGRRATRQPSGGSATVAGADARPPRCGHRDAVTTAGRRR